MSDLFTSRLLKFFELAKDWQLFLALFGYTLFLRFPFFFRDYIDRDESTFILMGQSWLEGHLPYTELWDLKPPITFLFFAMVIKVLGKSFLAIRLFGSVLVAFAALYTYKIGLKLGAKKVAITTAFLVVILYSLFGSLQGVMSEHICMAFFVPGTYFFLKEGHNRILYIVSGIFFGLALMSKLNMGYPLLFLFGLQFYMAFQNRNFTQKIINLFCCGAGVLLVTFLTFIPYWISSQSEVWWNSVIQAPLSYSGSLDNSILKVLPLVFVVLGFLLWLFWKNWLDVKNPKLWSLFALVLGILFSFMQAGRANGHYLIQLHPFLLLLTAKAVASKNPFTKKVFPTLFIFILLAVPMETYAEWANVFKNKAANDSYFNGEGIQVPTYIKQNGLSTENILFLEYHIGYWLLDKTPPTKAATHPSNLLRDELFPYMGNPRRNKAEELIHLMEFIRPPYVVTRKNRRIFDKKQYAPNFYMNLQLLENYVPLDTIENAVIHKRLPAK